MNALNAVISIIVAINHCLFKYSKRSRGIYQIIAFQVLTEMCFVVKILIPKITAVFYFVGETDVVSLTNCALIIINPLIFSDIKTMSLQVRKAMCSKKFKYETYIEKEESQLQEYQ